MSRSGVTAIEFSINTLEGTLALVSMGAATPGASASLGMMGSTLICLIFVLLALCGLNLLCRRMKFSKGLLGSAIQINSKFATVHSFIRNKTKT
uniref:Uncharacterized protein n=1 Tax=Rhipicephalus zambeziensis TaxID=60191 RepID=A0A224YKK9_9ACAR